MGLGFYFTLTLNIVARAVINDLTPCQGTGFIIVPVLQKRSRFFDRFAKTILLTQHIRLFQAIILYIIGGIPCINQLLPLF